MMFHSGNGASSGELHCHPNFGPIASPPANNPLCNGLLLYGRARLALDAISTSLSNQYTRRLHDMETNNAESSRPSKVSAAVTLLYLSLALGVLPLPIALPPICDEHREIPGSVIVFIAIAVVAFFWFLIYKIGKGRNWARITYLVVFGIGVVIELPDVLAGLSGSSTAATGAPALALLGIATTILDVIALVLLFQAPSSEWFRQMKELASRQSQEALLGANLCPCPDCGRPVSRLAQSCPQCGRPLGPPSRGEP